MKSASATYMLLIVLQKNYELYVSVGLDFSSECESYVFINFNIFHNA